ncbi:PREDICTED: serine/arginine-rich splicing factor RS31-like [Tarenaya hassleriana]|uniref:serine/arginine-rich splicing factor RS31-like n=1 Tax=Tarenaya hassleriana TaxID=28532 RepID=UPI00053C6FC2|nr:PREDICTED: serine/arginine-rich splicing factor RS31-like [Tarenaya hassleriana]
MMRPLFVGNFEYDTRVSELEHLFRKYGRVERVDMKSGLYTWELGPFNMLHLLGLVSHSSHAMTLLLSSALHVHAGYAFVCFEDERDAEDAIRGLDNIPFGYERRRLSVEWAKGERIRPRDDRFLGNQKPTKTLFVINFDPIHTRERDIFRHFDRYGEVLNVRIRRNFAFVQFATQNDATKALECTQRSKLLDRVISVEYALRDDDDRHNRGSYGRSPSPDYHRRPSPDYGRRPLSPEYERYMGSSSRTKSPSYDRYRSRSPLLRK